jgi:phosphoglucomutase
MAVSTIKPISGQLAADTVPLNVPRLITAYYSERPDPSLPEQRVQFGTSGHRGSAFASSFNESHILAIAQSLCDHRYEQKITGPLFLGIDTHALSVPAFTTALEVFAANAVETTIAIEDEYTPTPAISHAILAYNRGRSSGFADGVVITPSHNPPKDGGFKYNPPHGGPAGTAVTQRIERGANGYLERGLRGIKRIPYARALCASTTHRYDFLDTYTSDLSNVIDLEAIRAANVSMGVDPLGGAGVRYWKRIAERFRLDLTVVNKTVDPSFGFMSVDWDGQIRMDPSSPFAMRTLIGMKDRFQVAFACDADHDRHGIVTPGAGLLPANDYLCVAIYFLFGHRPLWDLSTAVGKTLVSSRMIDRVAAKLNRSLYQVPVGFKWFVEGLGDASLGFAGEESAGASFLRRDGSVWTTDKDGIVAALLAGEITARLGRDPGEVYSDLTAELGTPAFARKDAPATSAQKQILKRLTAEQVQLTELAGEPVQRVLTHAPGNCAPIDGLKVETENAWFAARPSGTEDIYKIYAESFRGPDHLRLVLAQAQVIVDQAMQATPLSI